MSRDVSTASLSDAVNFETWNFSAFNLASKTAHPLESCALAAFQMAAIPEISSSSLILFLREIEVRKAIFILQSNFRRGAHIYRIFN